MANLQITRPIQAATGTGALAAGPARLAAAQGAALDKGGVQDPGKVSKAGAKDAGAGQSADLQASSNAKKAPPPAAANGTQMVYVFDEQLHRSVVKILDIETQKVMADPPGAGASGADATTQDEAASAQAVAANGKRVDTTA